MASLCALSWSQPPLNSEELTSAWSLGSHSSRPEAAKVAALCPVTSEQAPLSTVRLPREKACTGRLAFQCTRFAGGKPRGAKRGSLRSTRAPTRLPRPMPREGSPGAAAGQSPAAEGRKRRASEPRRPAPPPPSAPSGFLPSQRPGASLSPFRATGPGDYLGPEPSWPGARRRSRPADTPYTARPVLPGPGPGAPSLGSPAATQGAWGAPAGPAGLARCPTPKYGDIPVGRRRGRGEAGESLYKTLRAPATAHRAARAGRSSNRS